MLILWNSAYTNGSKLQYPAGSDPEYEGPLGRNQESGSGCTYYACIPDLLYDSIKVNKI